MSTYQGAPNQSEADVRRDAEALQEKILPTVRQIDGYQGVIGLTERSSGKGISLTFWETEEAMRASEEAADDLRRQAAATTEEEIAGVERFQVNIYEPPTHRITEQARR